MNYEFNTALELEEARQALLHDPHLSNNQKAAQAEKLGDYRSAKKLWQQVVNESKPNSLMQKYAHIRYMFCKTAAEHGFKRPELNYLWA